MWAAKTVTPPISSDSYICGWHDLACRVCHTLSRLVLITGMQCVQAWSQDNEIDQVCIRISCISLTGSGKVLLSYTLSRALQLTPSWCYVYWLTTWTVVIWLTWIEIGSILWIDKGIRDISLFGKCFLMLCICTLLLFPFERLRDFPNSAGAAASAFA